MAGAVTAAVSAPSSASAAPSGAAFTNLDAATQQPASVARPAADVRRAAAVSADRFSLQTRQVAFDQAAEAAAAKKAAARKAAARKAAAAKKAAAARKVAEQRAVTSSSGSPKQVAQAMLGQFGWSDSQYGCLVPLWGKESGWSTSAENPSSGAYGIPQALPGSKMASAGPDWQSNAATQIKWGLQYIQSTYGSPCGAWEHEVSDGWY